MAQKAPGKSHRKGLTLFQVADMFADEEKARLWIEERLWPEGPYCPKCGTFNVQSSIRHKTMTHRCRECEGRPMFSLKTGSVMEGSKIRYRVWAIGLYLFTTDIKGISSMKLHRGLGIGQKAAWFMLQRLREAAKSGSVTFTGPVEADAIHVASKRRNMSDRKRKELMDTGRCPVGKEAVVGVHDRETRHVRAKVVRHTDRETIQSFVIEHTADDATIYTDEASACEGMPRTHESVKPIVPEHVRDQAHTNGMESFRAVFKRGYHGTCHKVGPKHLDRYVTECVGRHNIGEQSPVDQMGHVATGMTGKRLRYRDLIADNGLSSGARS